jgi:hypothetical protein
MAERSLTAARLMYYGVNVHPKEAVMDKLVRRVTVIERKGDENLPRAVVVYKEPSRGRASVSILTRPFEQGAKHLLKAQIIFGQEALRRLEKSNRRRRDGWLLEGPSNFVESGRKAVNEARKAIPFKLLPKV